LESYQWSVGYRAVIALLRYGENGEIELIEISLVEPRLTPLALDAATPSDVEAAGVMNEIVSIVSRLNSPRQ
jgi:hypothetical protein